jgi:GntR family transcriptional regulator, transcriptional repressor for pyruvate dehydrogenase complex
MMDSTLRFPVASARPRAADQVFTALANAILRGQLVAGGPLPAERTLAAQFHVSRILVRQAVHRLEELGLLRIRQGGQTFILDPTQSKDPRVLMLRIELCLVDPALLRDVAERQLLHGVILLEAASRHLDSATLDHLDALILELEQAGDEGTTEFIARFWQQIATATQNQIFEREVHFWFELLQRKLGTLRSPGGWDHADRVRVHRELVARMRRGEPASDYFLREIRSAFREAWAR